MKNLLLQPTLIEQLDQNLNSDDFKDFILKLRDYFFYGVEPEFEGIKKTMFEMVRPYYIYLDRKYDFYLEEKEKKDLGVETIDDYMPMIPVNKRY